MFLAILSDSFGEVKAEIARRKNAFEMGEYFREGYVNLIDRMGLHTRKMDVEEALKMAKEKDYNNKEEVREFLRKHNFGEIEVDIFFENFEWDYKRDVANADINEIELELEDVDPEQGTILESIETRPMSGKEARQKRAERIASAISRINPDENTENKNIEEESIEYELFESLSKRVEDIEHISSAINKKITIVLNKLDAVQIGENKKKKHLNKLMDGFVSVDNDMDDMGSTVGFNNFDDMDDMEDDTGEDDMDDTIGFNNFDDMDDDDMDDTVGFNNFDDMDD